VIVSQTARPYPLPNVFSKPLLRRKQRDAFPIVDKGFDPVTQNKIGKLPIPQDSFFPFPEGFKTGRRAFEHKR
ncbi:hypothetical protein, partial [Acinetobacter baumannii]|uniref:hypothetical protein n=1 Tax=Acinetobacter baumannii TaxID=470 RepID=UPI001BC89795